MRVYERKFDWDEARRRHAAGETPTSIGRDLGVSATAIMRVVDPNVYERLDRTTRAWQRNGTCPRCGNRATRAGHQHLCNLCAALAAATTVRDTTLQCVTCHEWKPDDQFARDKNRIARRGRHRQCTACNTIAKREWRKKAGRW